MNSGNTMIRLTFALTLLSLRVSKARSNTCKLVADAGRIDCHPSPNATEAACVERGCCWAPATSGIAVDVPHCFYPLDYRGYTVKGIQSIVGGTRYLLEREERSYLPDEIRLLTADLTYVSDSILRLRIIDRYESRFEVPYVFNVTPIEAPATNSFSVKVSVNPFSVAVWNRLTGEQILDTSVGPLLYADQYLEISSKLPNSYVYGLGEHRNPLRLDCGWQTLVFWNRDQPPVINHNLYGSQPMLIAPGNQGKYHYGMFMLNANAMEAVLQPLPSITFRTIGGVIDLFVYAGPTPQDVVRQHWTVVQFPHFQPYWAMGFHLCRYGYNSIANLREVMRRMDDTGFQYDVQWTDIDAMRDRLVFTYDDANWPGLPDLVRELHQRDMRYTPINDPCIGKVSPDSYPALEEGLRLDVFIRDAKDDLLTGRVWPGDCYFPDFTSPNAVQWWRSEINKFNETAPFDGFWIDMNEPANFVAGSVNGCTTDRLDQPWYVPRVVGDTLYDKTVCPSAKQVMSTQYDLHNLYALIETKVTLEAIDAITPTKRHFVLSRATFAGSGHYAGHWSGDNWSTWSDLYYSIAEILAFQFYGLPFVGADICGFFDNTTEELCMRWMQLGAFYPFMRNHNTIDVAPQDPAVFTDAAREVMHKALLIRYRLLPYWYTLNYYAAKHGNVILSPMFFICPQDPVCQQSDSQFLLGEALLVAPVTTEGATSMYVYLPDQGGDAYYNYYTGESVPLSGWVEISVVPETLGLFWRAGHIVPTHLIDETKNALQNRVSNFSLLVTLSGNKMSEGTLYWDDGFTKDAPSTIVMFSAVDQYVTVSTTQAEYEGLMLLDEIKVLGIQNRPVSRVSVDDQGHSTFERVSTQLTIQSLARNMNVLMSFTVSWEYE